MNYEKARQFILEKLEKELPQNLHYHSIHHTIDVCDAVERIGLLENISSEEIILVKTAALYHDSGFIYQYLKNEPVGVEIARKSLPEFNYSDQEIDLISEIIMATQIPQTSKNLLEEIMCDADLDYLGRDDFHPIADSLKQELMEHQMVKSDKHWDEIQISFLTQHKYFTKTANRLRNNKKQDNLNEVIHRYKNELYS